MKKIFYFMGASGSGKDSIINAIKLQNTENLMVAHRYITRKPDLSGENHVYLTNHEFNIRLKNNLFSMYWCANNYKYALGKEIEHWLNSSFNVLINGSRAYLSNAQNQFGASLIPISINVDSNVLKERLHLRGRESSEEINMRIKRSKEFNLNSNADYIISNNGSIESSVVQFNEIYNIFNNK